MNPFTLALSCLLLIPAAVFGGSFNNVLRPVPNSSSGSDSSEEYFSDLEGSKYGSIPQTFDARSKWPHCPSISNVPNRKCCHASFAVVPTSVMTDRTCIMTNRTDVVYSAYDPIACCESCVSKPENKCWGGKSEQVWKYWANTGIVTESCLPYPYHDDCSQQSCPNRCVGMSSKTVTSDRRKGQMPYIMITNVRAIQQEIMANGPVEASFDMYVDFTNYTGKDVYVHRRGPYLEKQHVKIIGWGTQDGFDYWLIVNNFGEEWGNRGFGKFRRGINHCNIESRIQAAMPL